MGGVLATASTPSLHFIILCGSDTQTPQHLGRGIAVRCAAPGRGDRPGPAWAQVAVLGTHKQVISRNVARSVQVSIVRGVPQEVLASWAGDGQRAAGGMLGPPDGLTHLSVPASIDARSLLLAAIGGWTPVAQQARRPRRAARPANFRAEAQRGARFFSQLQHTLQSSLMQASARLAAAPQSQYPSNRRRPQEAGNAPPARPWGAARSARSRRLADDVCAPPAAAGATGSKGRGGEALSQEDYG